MKKKTLILLVGLTIFAILILINPGQFFTLTILRILGHYKTPRIETPVSIKEYVETHNLYYDKLYSVSSMNAFIELGQSGIHGVPTIQIFNKKKALLRMASENKCTWALADYFKNGHSNEMIAQDTTTFAFVLDRLTPIDIKSVQDTFDFYIISYWAKYIPKLTHHLFEQTNSMKSSMTEKICYIYVTLDEQENWKSGDSN